MTPIIATALKHLASLLRSDASADRASGSPFQQWDRKHFQKWTQASADQRTGKQRRRQRFMASQARSSYAVFYQ